MIPCPLLKPNMISHSIYIYILYDIIFNFNTVLYLQQVDEATVGEPGWLCGSYRGNRGWFPQSYAERCAASSASSTTTNTTNTTSSSEAAPPASQAGPLPSSVAPPSAASG